MFFGFCFTSAWISHWHTYVSSLWNLPLTPSHPFRLSRSTWPELPVSYSKFPLLSILHMCVLVAQECLTLCNPMDCSPPGFSVHGILQARILEWLAIPFSRESSQPRDWTWVSFIAGRFFTIWITREAHFTYGNIYISVLLSQFIPCSPALAVS